jgi:hypothetical protein
MKEIIFSNWNFMRFLRLAIGIGIIVESIATSQWALLILGVLFTIMPVLNVACCGAGGCSVPTRKYKQPEQETNYEE